MKETTYKEDVTKVLIELEETFWEHDVYAREYVGFEKDAIRAATKIFTSVLFDLSFQILEDRGVSFDDRCILAESMGTDIRDIIQKYTGYNSTKFYKE